MLAEHLFNFHDLVQMMTASLCVLLALPLSLRHRQHPANLPLAAFLLTQAVSVANYVLLYNAFLGPFTIELLRPLQFLPLQLAYMAQGICLLWYAYALVQKPMRWHRGDAILAGALIALTVVHAMVYLLRRDGTEPSLMGAIAPFPGLAMSTIFGIRAVLVIRRYNDEIKQRYSNIEDSNLRWLAYASCGFVVIWMWRLLGAGIVASYPMGILVTTMVILGLSHRSRPVYARPQEAEARSRAGAAPPSDEQAARLRDLMERVQVYQDPELDLDGLADSMSMSPRSLSTLINGHFKRNFYDFVNHFRIEEAKAQLANPQFRDKTVQRVFEDVGFNSKSTFNSTFKRLTGKTPSVYRRESLMNGQEPVMSRLPDFK